MTIGIRLAELHPCSRFTKWSEYDDKIIVNVLSSSIVSDGAVYMIVMDDNSYNGDNIEEFKEDLDIVFKIR